jgi:membrane associated rhomboid family serine protease
MPQQQTAGTLRTIWLALSASTLIYAVMVYILFGQTPQRLFADVFREPLVMTLYALAIASFFAGTIIWNAMADRPPQLRMVTAMAVYESGAIFGLVAAFTSHDWRLYVPPWILTMVGFRRTFPSDIA